MFIPIILGTARKGRRSEKAADFVLHKVLERGIESELIDVRDYRIEATDNSGESDQAKRLAEKIGKADGLVIVSPEYNHGYPGELKMMMDMLYEEYHGKPVGICGVSLGGLGGARMVEQLRQVAIEFHMIPIREAVYFSSIGELFDEKGDILDPIYNERVDKFLDQLIEYAKR